MDKSLRNTLRNIVTHCRRLLEEAIAELLQGQFGIHSSGKIEDAASLSHLSEEDRAYWAQILVHLAHIGAGGQGAGTGKKKQAADPQSPTPDPQAVAQLIREVAFTHLNRLAAYKMMETRGLIRESVSRGVKSQGFLFYLADHPEDEKLWSSGQQERAYRHFLTWLGGTLSQEIGVLFSPDDPANRLLPPQRVLDGVLDLLNSADLSTIWAEDETIGWIYQYFTPKELRDQARSESQAPRNSYELAFRNQFYTPRYVVQFLTDNTLGRIWYEIRRGETRLAEVCQYLVRRPNEVFLREGQQGSGGAGEQGSDGANGESTHHAPRNTQHQAPVYIPYRPKKDPRDLKILDPASGSGHFLLYCFDLLEIIYEEAYTDPDLGPALQADYPTLADLRKAIPALILRHNLHGIDIDPRAVQIASLALWLRAKKSRGTEEQGGRGELSSRFTHHVSRITKMNIVCAEPMPGNAALLDEFTAGLQPPLLGQLLRAIVGKMELAGEAGSLLKIEEEIDDALAAAKKQWLAGPKPEQLSFFPQEKKPEQLNMFDLTGISDEQFWDEAEGRLLAALRDYAEHASGDAGLARRLFADDTARGFAFIHLCRQHFDVVLMNPPFGEGSKLAKIYVEQNYPRSKNDVYATFVERWLNELTLGGLLGAITSRTGFFLSSFQKWREEILLDKANPTLFADLGFGVLDTAMVETAAYCLSTQTTGESHFLRLLSESDKPLALTKAVSMLQQDPSVEAVYTLNSSSFRKMPGSPFAYWISEEIRQLFVELPQFENEGRIVKSGLCTGNDFRFVRTWWEVVADKILDGNSTITWKTDLETFRVWCHQRTHQGKEWILFVKGDTRSPYYTDPQLVVNWAQDGSQIKQGAADGTLPGARPQNIDFYFLPGITWPTRPHKRGYFSHVSAGATFSHNSTMLFLPPDIHWATCALLNSDAYIGLLHTLISRGSGQSSQTLTYEVGLVSSVPIPYCHYEAISKLSQIARQSYTLVRDIDTVVETGHAFLQPALLRNFSRKGLAELCQEWIDQLNKVKEQLFINQAEVNDTAFCLYGINDLDRLMIERSLNDQRTDRSSSNLDIDDDDNEVSEVGITVEVNKLVAELLSYGVGCSFGRWDIRYATGEQSKPELPDPFSPLPVYPPGMITDPLPTSYPLVLDLDSILVDDIDHPDDIVGRIREVLELLWGDRAEAIEREANEILGVKDLRAYFRNPGKGGFWLDHVKRYSKSHRKAPIYWLLQSSRKNYALWLYYHRLDKDILYKALVNFVEPKIRLEEGRLEGIRGQLSVNSGQLSVGGRELRTTHQRVASPGDAPRSGKSQKALEKDLDQQESFVAELHDFRDKLRRAAHLNLEPDLNDGVMLNIAPLWELVAWKEARQYWEELLAGKYEWSSVGRHLREKGLVKQG